MKSLLVLILLAAFSITLIAADAPPTAGVVQVSRDKVDAAFATGGVILATNNFKIQTGRRTGPGDVEIHEHDTDVFYILEGKATFVTGGKAVEPKPTAPGELRAKEIRGGEERQLVKGDVIVIPNGVPHWFKKVDGAFVYFVVKIAEEKK